MRGYECLGLFFGKDENFIYADFDLVCYNVG